MPIYTDREQVKLRVKGKVRFTADVDDEDKMPEALLDRLIDEAEGEVEHDLSFRYFIPFQGFSGEPFSQLPPRPTREMIRTLCELKSVMRVLETDFGDSGPSDADKYMKGISKRYDSLLEKLIKRRDDDQRWTHPPLQGLRLATHNTECDDGYHGMVLSTSQGFGDYPSKQINEPSQTFWNGTVQDDEGDPL